MNSFSYRKLTAFSWALYVQNAAFLSGVLLVLWSYIVATQFIAIVLFYEVGMAAAVGVLLVGWAFSVLLSMGFLFCTVKLARKRKVKTEDLLVPSSSFSSYIAASLLYHIIVLFGLLLLIVPGFVWAVKYIFYRHLIVDQDLDALQALYISGRMTEGVRLKVFGLATLCGVINIFGLLSFGVGLLVTVPFTNMLFSRLYERQLVRFQKEIAAL